MTPFYVHDSDGRILRHGHCQDVDLEHQAGEGETVVEGEADFQTQYVGAKGELVDMPEQPSPSHEFDWKAKAWVPNPDLAWQQIRAERLGLLRSTDWMFLADAPVDPAELEQWKAYRQSLRDITEQPDPLTVAWPAAPDQEVTVDPAPVAKAPDAG